MRIIGCISTMLLLVINQSALHAQSNSLKPAAFTSEKKISNEALMDSVQRRSFLYFWDFAHPVSGLPRERYKEHDTVTMGGSGFGFMSIIVAMDRKWITREEGIQRLKKMIDFLMHADSYHGMFPHWMNGATGKTIPFSRKDDGADLVESSFLFEGLIAVREYLNAESPVEAELQQKINRLWKEAEWNWFTQGNTDTLYWHWSPNNGWAKNLAIRGWNECLIVYVLAAGADKYAISPAVYHHGWAGAAKFKNGDSYYGYTLPVGKPLGGPLFFAHYSFMGIDPRGLKDQYADYWQQNTNHALINHAYCVENPKHFKGYSDSCWGLTASDDHKGYSAHSPANDLGVISPTAALASFPYTPEQSMKALRYFYEKENAGLWGPYGFYDAFTPSENWYSRQYLAIDQGPIVVMMENFRSQLLWNLFMKAPEVQKGLKRLGFTSPHLK